MNKLKQLQNDKLYKGKSPTNCGVMKHVNILSTLDKHQEIRIKITSCYNRNLGVLNLAVCTDCDTEFVLASLHVFLFFKCILLTMSE